MAHELTVPAPAFTLPSVIGAAAGGAATIPMALFMLAMHKFLPRWQKETLPPEKIKEVFLVWASGLLAIWVGYLRENSRLLELMRHNNVIFL